jgi:uncharacterized protein (TIGR03083 family)
VHDATGIRPAVLYRETRLRLTELVSGLGQEALGSPVPACPGWAVRDVVAHLAGIADDAVAGRLAGIPDDDYTAGQVARLAEVPVPQLLTMWAGAADQFEAAVDALEIWPAVVDVASHEQDIRSAAGLPGARDCQAIRECTAWLLRWLVVPAALTVVTEDGEFTSRLGDRPGPGEASASTTAGSGERPGLTLITSRFEAFRWRMGRRSRPQMAAMYWSADHSPVIDYLAVFGPATADIIE